MRSDLRSVDVAAAVRLARGCADDLWREAADPAVDLTTGERRGLLTIAAAVDRRVTLWAGLEPRSPEAQAVIDTALAAVLP